VRETFHNGPLNDPAFAHLDARHTQPAYRLVERFVIHTTPERCGELWKPVGPFTRASARRIVVRELTGGPVIFDTDECYDVGNASNKLELWLADLDKRLPV
jgi:hypothetical protein